jgi:hypothetical protein
MKKVIFLSLLVSSQVFAAQTKQTLQGTGIDGNPCAVEIIRDGDVLKKVTLTGASENYEVINEGFRPKTSISPHGGQEALGPAGKQDNTAILAYFRHSSGLFSARETFQFDSKDLPGDNPLRGVKMVSALQLDYDGHDLVEVKAGSKIKGLGVLTLGSVKFSCTK